MNCSNCPGSSHPRFASELSDPCSRGELGPRGQKEKSSPEVGTRLPFIPQHIPSKAALVVGSLEMSYGKDMSKA